MARHALLGRVLVFASGNVLYAICHFILIIMLARLGTPLLVGAYSLATAVQNPLFTFSKMGMRQAQATEQAEEFPFNAYMRLRVLLLVTAVAVGLALLPFLATSPLLLYVFVVVLVANAFDSLSDIYYGLLLQNERQHVIGTSLFLRALTSVASFALVFVFTRDAEIALVGLPIGWALMFFFHDRLRSRDIAAARKGQSVSPGQLGRLFGLLWPLALAGFLGQGGQGLPRYIIAWDEGAEILGQVSPALQLHVAVGMLAQSVGQSLLPGVARDLLSGEGRVAWRRLMRVSAALLPIVLISCVACFLLGPWVVRLVFGPGYELAGALLGAASVSWSLRAYAALFQNAVVGKRDFRRLLRIQLLISGLGVAVLVPLGLLFGVGGAVWGMACVSAIQFGVFFLQARRQLTEAVG